MGLLRKEENNKKGESLKIGVSVVTYNGGNVWSKAAKSLYENLNDNIDVLVIDSGSTDETCKISLSFGFDLIEIPSSEFNHGGTRNMAVDKLFDCDIIVFLTQDCILHSKDSIKTLVNFILDNNLVAAYGKQLPHKNATAIAVHAREFNYRENSYVCSKSSIKEYGIKAAFMSNSFSAYTRDYFLKSGGFPNNTILCEDMFFSAKAILAGYKIGYCANAKAFHSHNYSAIDEFKRYFDIGVFHYTNTWIKNEFGGAGGEGRKFLLSEFKFLLKTNPKLIPLGFVNNLAKAIGFKLGWVHNIMPMCLIKRLSMHKKFWCNHSIRK